MQPWNLALAAAITVITAITADHAGVARAAQPPEQARAGIAQATRAKPRPWLTRNKTRLALAPLFPGIAAASRAPQRWKALSLLRANLIQLTAGVAAAKYGVWAEAMPVAWAGIYYAATGGSIRSTNRVVT